MANRPNHFGALLAALGIYAFALVYWLIGAYFSVFPLPDKGDASGFFFPPLVLPLVFIAWREIKPRDQSAEGTRLMETRCGQLVLAACAASLIEGVGNGFFARSWGETYGVWLATLVMSVIPAIALIHDRDVKTTLLLVGIELVALLPVVVAGRLLGMFAWRLRSFVRF